MVNNSIFNPSGFLPTHNIYESALDRVEVRQPGANSDSDLISLS
jgi:hypothetical protein